MPFLMFSGMYMCFKLGRVSRGTIWQDISLTFNFFLRGNERGLRESLQGNLAWKGLLLINSCLRKNLVKIQRNLQIKGDSHASFYKQSII